MNERYSLRLAVLQALPVAQLTLQYGAWLNPAQSANASYLLSLSDWESWSKTGTNAVDIGKVRITRGVVIANMSSEQRQRWRHCDTGHCALLLAVVQEAFSVIYSTFQYADQLPPNSPEGPKKDGSFMQHGPQLYNGNYGVGTTKADFERCCSTFL